MATLRPPLGPGTTQLSPQAWWRIEMPHRLRRPMRASAVRADRERGPRLPAALRAARRLFLLHRPGALLVLALLAVVVPVVVDMIPASGDWIKRELSEKHEVAVNLGEHVVVALLAAAAAYYQVLGRKRQKALREYRERILADRRALVDWYPAGREIPALRQRSSEQLTKTPRSSGVARPRLPSSRAERAPGAPAS